LSGAATNRAFGQRCIMSASAASRVCALS
jgi:hypothetical protein